MTILNSVPPILASEQQKDQVAVVDLLKEALAQALEGSITSIGIIVCMKNGYAHVVAGRQAADLNLGCDSLKAEILRRTEAEGARRSQRLQR